ncbi:MAG: L-threonylcarbamoyladenylate synthase [Actinomycetaceae bacterium]|nr:threonylcarbamoyl-AMP synthase [Arcanobacterium sp.]MDD7504978.1 L-threonylcarbamoyladenylate synthase [Actinomycetaceae bacterium]MDY6143365.1 L-threonylcarbamoyladenylate synthase [Arcanobacterium sp.]
MEIYRADQPSERALALASAAAAVCHGEVICLPTDTVYGIGADPYNADAVTALLAAKSRTRAMPPPVLVPNWEVGRQLIAWHPAQAESLIEAYWPGALTLIFPARQSVGWDLGETNGTVALRIPDHPVALELLGETGPLAVTSANKTGEPPASTIENAVSQLGDAVAVYIDAGGAPGGVPSTILRFDPEHDGVAELVREGAIAPADIERVSHLEVRG